MKAIVLAAGLGTRLLHKTEHVPKALVELSGKPLIQHVMEKLICEGVREFYVNVFHFADQVITFLNDFSKDKTINIKISPEAELLDSGGGIKKIIADFNISDPILIHNVDIISNVSSKLLFDYHKQNRHDTTLLIQHRNTDRFLLFDEQMNLCGRANPDKSIERLTKYPIGITDCCAFCGIYVVNPELFLKSKNDKFSSIELLLENPQKNVKGFIQDNIYWRDVGNPQDLKAAKEEIKLL